MIECSECGHLHYNASTRNYTDCPLRDEGCTCPFKDGPFPDYYDHPALLARQETSIAIAHLRLDDIEDLAAKMQDQGWLKTQSIESLVKVRDRLDDIFRDLEKLMDDMENANL